MTQIMHAVPDGTSSRSSWSSLTVPVSPALREAVEQSAADLDRSMAAVVREALRKYVGLEDGRGNA